MSDTQIRRALGFLASGIALLAATASVGAQQTGPGPVPTFAKDVAPLLYKNCVSCHRPGEMGPMSLVTYQEARPWARSIRDRVVARSMPPWFADPHYGTFSNDPTLSQKDIDTIVAWVGGGAPQGDLTQMPQLPRTMVAGWQIGTPDVVFEMPEEFHVPATGTIAYKTYNVKTTFKEDLWVVAAEVRPEDRAHVHHAVVTVIEPGGNKPLGAVEVTPLPQDRQKDSHLTPEELEKRLNTERGRSASTEHRLAGYAVGEGPRMIPAGYAKRVPAGSTLSFSMHYTTNGTEGRDRTKIGLVLAKQPPTAEMYMGLINNGLFEIPPGDANTLVASEGLLQQDIHVWAIHPHMHVRGKDMTYTAILPDGRREILLSVPKYRFDWQLDYYLSEPKALPKGTKILVTAHYDNSPANKDNPDPAATVHYGDQTWDEMMAGYFTYTIDGQTKTATSGQR
jgi:mono/diheme cytochrome c family protein